MSIRPVNYSHLQCDTCGAIRAFPVIGPTSARIAGAAEGWKFTEWDVKGLMRGQPQEEGPKPSYGRRGRMLPRTWDCCPTCPLPAGPREAAEIRDSGTQRAHYIEGPS